MARYRPRAHSPSPPTPPPAPPPLRRVRRLVAGSPPALHAEGFRSPTTGSSGLATTGGRIAFVDDAASAVFHNPANLVELPRWEAAAEPTFVHHSVEYESPTGARQSTTDPWKALPHLSPGGPLDADGRSAALGVGLSVPLASPCRRLGPRTAASLPLYGAPLRPAQDLQPESQRRLPPRRQPPDRRRLRPDVVRTDPQPVLSLGLLRRVP